MKDAITNSPPTCRYDRIKAELIRCLSLPQEQRVRQLLMHDEIGDRRSTQFFRHLRTLADPSGPSDFLLTLWTNRPPQNIQATTATQAQVALDDVAQLVVKIAEVTPPPCLARASSFGDEIGTLTAHTDELAWQVTALSAIPSRPCSPSQTRRHVRRSSCYAGWSPPLKSAGSTAVLNGVQRDAPRPVCGSREIWMAVASGGEQLQQLSQPPLCYGSVHKDKRFGRHWRRFLRLPRSRLRERRTQTSYEFLEANSIIVHTYGYITLRLDLGLRREFSWPSVVADETPPIKGSDFLYFYHLLVNIRHRRLIDSITNLTANGTLVGTHGDHISPCWDLSLSRPGPGFSRYNLPCMYSPSTPAI